MQGTDDVWRALLGERMDRRRFLKGSVSGVLLLGAGSLLPAGCKSYPKPAVPLRFFNAREYAIMNAVAERLLGVAGHIGSAAAQIDVAAHVDAHVAEWEADSQRQLRTMLRVFEHGTYLFDLRRQRFTRLDAPQQDQYLSGWMNSTLGARRLVFRALKSLAAMGFFEDPRTWARLHYDGPWFGRIYASPRLEAERLAPLAAVLKNRR